MELSQEARIKLLNVCVERLSVSDLRNICYYLRVGYENLEGGIHADKVRELILYLETRGRLHEIAQAGQEYRDDIDWGEFFPGQVAAKPRRGGPQQRGGVEQHEGPTLPARTARRADSFELQVDANGSLDAVLRAYDGRESYAQERVPGDLSLWHDISSQLDGLRGDGLAGELQSLGQDLYRFLFPGQVGGLLEWAVQNVNNERLQGDADRWLRLVVDADARSPVATWPLELLYCRSLRYWLGTAVPTISFSRRPRAARRSGTRPRDAMLRVLLVVSDPVGLVPIECASGLAGIGRLASGVPGIGAGQSAAMEVRVLGEVADQGPVPGIHYIGAPATYENLSEVALDGSWVPHVLHFVGHSRFGHEGEQGALGLVGERGGVDWCWGDPLLELFGGWTPHLVLLQTCEGTLPGTESGLLGFANHLAARDISSLVAMQFPLGDDDAAGFVAGLYQALEAGDDIDEAVQKGRNRIWIRHRGTAHHFGTPVLFTSSPQGFIQRAGRAGGRARRGAPGRAFLDPGRAPAREGVDQARYRIRKALGWLGEGDLGIDERQAHIWIESAMTALRGGHSKVSGVLAEAAECLEQEDLRSAKAMLENALENLDVPESIFQGERPSAQPVYGGRERWQHSPAASGKQRSMGGLWDSVSGSPPQGKR